MACSGLTNVTLTIVACGSLFFFQPAPRNSRLRQIRRCSADGDTLSACLAVASMVVLHFSKLPAKDSLWAGIMGPWDL